MVFFIEILNFKNFVRWPCNIITKSKEMKLVFFCLNLIHPSVGIVVDHTSNGLSLPWVAKWQANNLPKGA
jgi:hypothetical protein